MVAWNAPFDRAFLEPILGPRKWADAQRHLTWSKGSQALVRVAAEDGRILNPLPHQALGDVMTMACLVGPRMDALIERAAMPEVEVVERVPFSANDALKLRGYHWQPERKVWARTLPVAWLDDERAWAAGIGGTIFEK